VTTTTPARVVALTPTEADRLRAVAARVPVSHASAQNGCGVMLARRGLLDDAASCFERALDADARHAVAADNLRRLATRGTVDLDRVAALTTRLRAEAGDAEAALALGRWHARLGRPVDARPVLAALVKRRPDHLAALRELAVVEHACGDIAAALAWLERAIAVDGRDATLHAQLGELLYRSGRPDAARTALERATALDPHAAWPLHMLAFVLGDLGEPEAARGAAQRALALDPSLARVEPQLTLEPRQSRGVAAQREPGQGRAAAQLQLAHAFRNTGLHEQALAALAAAREAGAPLDDVLVATCAVHALRGDWRAALACADERIAHAPDRPAVHASRAALLLRTGDPAAACAAAGDALALDPAHGPALLAHAVASALLGDTAVALATAQRARGGTRLEAAARCNAAWLLRHIGRAAPALEGFRRVTELQPQNVRAWIGMGVALMELRRPVEAIAALEQATALESGGGDAAHHLALALSQCGRWQAALAAMKRAVAAEADFAPFRYEVVLDPDVPDLVLEIPAGELRPIRDAAELLEVAERTPGPVAAVAAEAQRLAFTAGASRTTPTRTPHGAWVALRRGITPPTPRTPTGRVRPVVRDTGVHVPSPVRAAAIRTTDASPVVADPFAGDDEATLRAILARDPDVAAARVALAALLRADGRETEAEAQLRHAVETVPTWRAAARALSELLVDTHRPTEALDALACALRADPDDAGLLVAACEALLALGRDDRALDALRRAVRVAPDHAGVRMLRGWLALREGRPRDAVRHWEVAASAPVDARWTRRARRALAEHESTPVPAVDMTVDLRGRH
jgi:tetratricopeptide (TPR) repeat protein